LPLSGAPDLPASGGTRTPNNTNNFLFIKNLFNRTTLNKNFIQSYKTKNYKNAEPAYGRQVRKQPAPNLIRGRPLDWLDISNK
jgi:hypothetical protein